MLREYTWRGGTWQFDEDERPEGAVPVEEARPKARKAKTKERAPGADKGAAILSGDGGER